MPQYVVLYCYKVNKEGRMRADGIARCNEACRVASRLGNNALILFSLDVRRVPKMLEAMLCQFDHFGWPLSKIIVLNEVAHDTLSETKCAMNFLQRRGVNTVHIVTSHYHMDRALATWRGWAYPETVVPHPSIFSETPFLSWLHERFAFMKLFLHPK